MRAIDLQTHDSQKLFLSTSFLFFFGAFPMAWSLDDPPEGWKVEKSSGELPVQTVQAGHKLQQAGHKLLQAEQFSIPNYRKRSKNILVHWKILCALQAMTG